MKTDINFIKHGSVKEVRYSFRVFVGVLLLAMLGCLIHFYSQSFDGFPEKVRISNTLIQEEKAPDWFNQLSQDQAFHRKAKDLLADLSNRSEVTIDTILFSANTQSIELSLQANSQAPMVEWLAQTVNTESTITLAGFAIEKRSDAWNASIKLNIAAGVTYE